MTKQITAQIIYWRPYIYYSRKHKRVYNLIYLHDSTYLEEICHNPNYSYIYMILFFAAQ